MRYLIASDIHGALPAAEALMERFREEGADRLLLLGDLLYHGPRNPLPTGYAPAEVARLLNRYADRITAVRGNCEAEADQMMLDFPCLGDYTLVVDEGTTLLLTHGHLNLGTVVAGLPAGSFVFSGHSHIKGIGPQAAPAFVRDAASFPGSRRAGDSADDGRRDSEGGGGGVAGERGGSDDPAPAITFVNPGSIGHPKDGSASYALYERGAVKLHML